MPRLDTLPTELLEIIFKYCNAYDLARLNQVCRRFYEILRADSIWMSMDKPLVTNQVSEKFRERCNALLCASNKWRVSHNWQHRKYCERIIFSDPKEKPYPVYPYNMLLRMTNEELWLSVGKILLSFDRKPTKSVFDIQQNCTRFQVVEKLFDLSTFVLTKDFIVTANKCGTVKFLPYLPYGRYSWEDNYNDDTVWISNVLENYHDSNINDMDATSDLIITGSDDHTVKIKRLPGIAEEISHSATCLTLESMVMSVAANPTGTILAIGTFANHDPRSLHMVDIKECRKMHDYIDFNFIRNDGIINMVWQSPYILLTCHLDNHIRKWDIRTKNCVTSWKSLESRFKCMSSDYEYTMITGMSSKNMAILWDQRQRNYVQRYFIGPPTDHNYLYQIHSLQFDSSQLYCATHYHLAELRFADRTRHSLIAKIFTGGLRRKGNNKYKYYFSN